MKARIIWSCLLAMQIALAVCLYRHWGEEEAENEREYRAAMAQVARLLEEAPDKKALGETLKKLKFTTARELREQLEAMHVAAPVQEATENTSQEAQP